MTEQKYERYLDAIEANRGPQARSNASYLFVTGKIHEDAFLQLTKGPQEQMMEQYLVEIKQRYGQETYAKVLSLLQQGHLGMDMLASLAGHPTGNAMVPEEITGIKERR